MSDVFLALYHWTIVNLAIAACVTAVLVGGWLRERQVMAEQRERVRQIAERTFNRRLHMDAANRLIEEVQREAA